MAFRRELHFFDSRYVETDVTVVSLFVTVDLVTLTALGGHRERAPACASDLDLGEVRQRLYAQHHATADSDLAACLGK